MRCAYTLLVSAGLLAGCGGSGSGGDDGAAGPGRGPGEIQRLEIVSTQDAYGGATPAGAAGPYQVITAVAHGRLDPRHPANAGIVDLDKAPVDADGLVSYASDVVILRPRNAADARRVLLYDVVNRGNKIAQGLLVGGGALVGGAAPGADFASVLQRGYTVVWSGWQGGITLTGNGASAPIGTDFPAARNADGSPITALVREEHIPDVAGRDTIALSYPPASLDERSETRLTARQSWLDAQGRMQYAAPAVDVSDWSYVTGADGSVSVRFTPPAAVPLAGGGSVPADAGTIYSFVYRARDPQVYGIGFAAVRDLIDFLRHRPQDGAGNANPLADLRQARCAAGSNCPASPDTHVDVTIAMGLSQSGRFLRDFLYQGFNGVEGRQVFDGMVPMIPGGRRMWLNERFAQPGRWSRQHEDHWMPGDQFPFAYNVTTDPVSGATDGLLRRCLEAANCPRIMQIDGSYEWWGGRGSLVVTDGRGQDLALPDNVRYYLIAGAQHGGGPGVTTGIVSQPTGGTCRYAVSPVTMAPVERALVQAMEDWIVHGTPPPASRYPTAASGQAVLPTAAAMGFPELSAISVPDGADATPLALSVPAIASINQLFLTDYSGAEPRADLARPYVQLVPRVDANGNEDGGILMPELAAPLATYAGWNIRAQGHAAGDGCLASGSAWPLAREPATRAATDPRSTLAELYGDRAGYLARYDAATDALLAAGLFTAIDAANYKAGARQLSPALLAP